jgi:hypothetical protein
VSGWKLAFAAQDRALRFQPTGIDGSRQPSENELAIARFQGERVAQITNALIAGRKTYG